MPRTRKRQLMTFDSAEKILKLTYVAEARSRKLLSIEGGRVKYNIHMTVARSWKNPEEWIRAHVVSWLVHASNRLDPKYHLFKQKAVLRAPRDWIRVPMRDVMRQRTVDPNFAETPDKLYKVMTISQSGSTGYETYSAWRAETTPRSSRPRCG